MRKRECPMLRARSCCPRMPNREPSASFDERHSLIERDEPVFRMSARARCRVEGRDSRSGRGLINTLLKSFHNELGLDDGCVPKSVDIQAVTSGNRLTPQQSSRR